MMKPGLQLRVSQQLALTPQLQQSIRLLQLSTLELQQEIEGMLESNPFLEEELGNESSDSSSSESEKGLLNSSPTSPIVESVTSKDSGDADKSSSNDELSEMEWSQLKDVSAPTDEDDEWQASLDTEDWGEGINLVAKEGEDDGAVKMLEWASSNDSLTEHLMQQVRTLRLSEEDAAALYILVESLDENGYLLDDLDEITDRLLSFYKNELTYELEHEDMLERLKCALLWLQSMEPAGVGARTLSECLILQLKQLPESEIQQLAITICGEFLDMLAKRDYRKLALQTNATEEQVREALQMVLRLDPKPGRQFSSSTATNILPDVEVKKSGSQWKAILNPDVMPKIRVNDIYAQALRTHKSSDGTQALSQRLQEAKWFIKNIQQRFETILRVSQAIVNRQKNFFSHGEIAMRPLVLREIADELGLHESTISRVTTAKYMKTPYGIFELKFFFGSSLSTEAGGNASSTAVRALIKQLISEEDTNKPLSDNDISKLLSEQGIQVARRTVAKYREGLKIATATLRKAI